MLFSLRRHGGLRQLTSFRIPLTQGDTNDGPAFCCENRRRNGGFDTVVFFVEVNWHGDSRKSRNG